MSPHCRQKLFPKSSSLRQQRTSLRPKKARPRDPKTAHIFRVTSEAYRMKSARKQRCFCHCYCCMGIYDATGRYDANSSSHKRANTTRCCGPMQLRSDKGSEDKGRRLTKDQHVNKRTETHINQISHHTLMTCRSPNMLLLAGAISSFLFFSNWRPPLLRHLYFSHLFKL